MRAAAAGGGGHGDNSGTSSFAFSVKPIIIYTTYIIERAGAN